jgi:para-aminobenzoate synthetase component 1
MSQGPRFWMDGLLATDLVEISHDPAALDNPGFWAVMATYEGRWSCAKFARVESSPAPDVEWHGITTPWSSSHSRADYMKYVEDIRNEIHQGNVYQANACRILSTPFVDGLAGLFFQITKQNPSPYMAYLDIPGWEIASASPELFISIDERRQILGKPIKGTSESREFGEKDRAENIMIVDLMRNDFGRICEPGSITTPRLLEVEQHPGLFHLVSDVAGVLKTDVNWSEISTALIPPGSISGAPKISAMREIARHEQPRGPYCGALGYVHNGVAKLSVGIRLFWREGDGELKFGTGAGITWGSDAAAEWDETELKAARLMAIASGKFQG